MLIRYIAAFLLMFSLFSCDKKKEAEKKIVEEGSYFSVKAFLDDQQKIYGDQPYTFYKIVTEDGKTDSSIVSTDNMDWEGIRKIFIESDISDPKFSDQYNFNVLEDAVTDTRSYYYEAKNDDLFTRILQINTNPENGKIKSVYIETKTDSWWQEKKQKLFYAPIDVIQIQEFESGFLKKKKNRVTEYRFM